MTTLQIDRLHASYYVPVGDAAVTAKLDDALGRVVADGLPAALLGRTLSDAHAVCVRDVALRVELDVRRSVEEAAGVWAAAIVGAVERRLAHVGTGDDGAVVVFHHDVDLLVDLVRSVATGDRARVWAWHQTGLLDPRIAWPGADDVATVLVRCPELVPAVVGATVDVIGAVLAPEGWLRLARAAAPLTAPAGGPFPSAGPRGGTPTTTASADGRSGGGAVAAARSLVPQSAWAAAGHGVLRQALAALALACVDPARSRHADTVEAVASAGDLDGPDAGRPTPDDVGGRPRAVGREEPGSPAPWDDAGEPAPPGPASSRQLADEAMGGAEPAPEPWPTDGAPVTSAVGGIFFLVHAITELDVVVDLEQGPLSDVEPAQVLARVAASATGAAVDDPAALAVAGWPCGEPTDPLHAPLAAEQEEAVAALGRRLRVWVLDRLGEDGDGDGDGDRDRDDLDWVWARSVAIDPRPGWVEATFGLDDVDVRLRIAGLDLDPGYVWWLGAVVRFRYV